MKIIFLDLDGVLNTSASTMAKIGKEYMSIDSRHLYFALRAQLAFDHDDTMPYGAEFAIQTNDPVAVGLLNRALRETDAQIVISSSHRNNFVRYDKTLAYGSEKHLHLIRLFFAVLGVDSSRIIDVTKAYTGERRGDEVREWLSRHGDVERYVIIDDSDDFDEDQHMVKCDPDKGFGVEEFRRTCRMLGSKQGMILTIDES